MQTITRVLSVFLASPSDVDDERLAADDLISDLNKITSNRLGWNIRLDKWEDTPPAFGRPQVIINPAVDTCDLFIGLLWQHWGQPTGQYSSGFEEEYERVRKRRKETGKPEIWLIFKAVDPERLKDPGVQLRKVIEFRKTQSDLGEVLYKNVSDVDDWRRKLSNWFWDHILSLRTEASQSGQPTSTPQAEPNEPIAESVTAAGKTKIPKQLIDLAELLIKTVKRGDLEFLPEDAKEFHEFEVARLFLLSATWMSRRHTGNTLGTHEVNLLYKHRDALKMTGVESLQLFRALLVDRGSVVPGWFWFNHLTAEVIRNSLLSLFKRDLSGDVRWRAIELLREGGLKLPKKLWPALPLTDDNQLVRSEAYEYLGMVGDDETRSRIEAIDFGDDSATAFAARSAALSISLRLRPVETAAALIASTEYSTDQTVSEIEPILSSVGVDVLSRGAESQWAAIRKVSTRELIRRKSLTPDLAKKLTEDPLVEIRELAFKELARQGTRPDMDILRKSLSNESPSEGPRAFSLSNMLGKRQQEKSGDPDAVMCSFFQAKPAQVASDALDWFARESVPAYRSLALDRYGAVQNDVRLDLDNDFARIRQRANEKIRSKLGDEAVNQIVERFKSVDDFIRSQYTEVALEALAIHGESSDIRFGRQHISSTYNSVKLAALRVVSRFGTAEDSAELLRLSKDSYGELRDEAGLGALRLAENPFEVAIELTKSSSDTLVKAAFAWLDAHDSREVQDFFERLLNDESDISRVRAVYYFSRKLTKKALTKLLNEQFERRTYYYNVVTWLDRLLYSPRSLRKFFVNQLRREATQA